MLFCVLFGMSMDYEAFLLSHVKEAHDAGAVTVASVIRGLERSGRIITSHGCSGALLVPATMHLLGEWNGWAPQWLRRYR